jgi:hypothetical protein
VPPKLQSDLPIVPLSGRDSSGVTALQQELSALVPPLPAIEDEPEPAPPAKSDKKGAEKGARDPKGTKRGDLRSGGGDPKAKRGDDPADRRLARDAKPDRASRPKNGGDKEKAPQDKWSRDKLSDAAADRRRDKGRDSRDDAGDATKKRPTAKGSPSTRGASPSKGSVKGRWDAELKAEVFLDDEGFEGDDFGADDEPRRPAGRGRREAASPRSAWKGAPVSSKAQPQRSSSTDSRKGSSKAPGRRSAAAEADAFDDSDDDSIVEGWDDFDDDFDDRSSSKRKQRASSAVDKLRRRSPRTAKVGADAEEAPLRRRVSSMDQYAMSLLRETRETGDRSPADNKDATPTETRRGRAPLGLRRRVTRARKTPSAGDAADEGA